MYFQGPSGEQGPRGEVGLKGDKVGGNTTCPNPFDTEFTFSYLQQVSIVS